MTFSAACGWSLLRSVLVTVVGLWGAVHLASLVPRQHNAARFVAWGLVLAPCLAPGLIVGYGYRNYSLSLVHFPSWNEALYAAILIGQAAPVGAMLLYFAPPPPLSASALHCWRMTEAADGSATVAGRVRRGWRRVAAELRGPRQAWLPAAAVMFLIAFQESEVAALMQVRGWPEWLFTRYAGLVDLGATRMRMLVLVAIQAVVVIPVVMWLWRNLATGQRPAIEPLRPVSRRWWLWPMLMGVLVAVIPSGVVLRGAWDGLSSLRQQPSFWRELAHGLAFALTSGALACTVSRWLLTRFSGQRPAGAYAPTRTQLFSPPLPDPPPAGRRGEGGSQLSPDARYGPLVLLALLLLPGMCGSMTLALLVDDLFQRSWLYWAYDSPARILTALTLSLLPRALLVQTCVPFHRPTAPVHAADLLRRGTHDQQRTGRELRWRLRGSPRFWTYALVCSWGYLDLMIATISAPPGMEPVVKRLYNFMHFGHIAGLSAMVCATVAAPALLVAAALATRRWWPRWNTA